jgi:hypothetical protein
MWGESPLERANLCRCITCPYNYSYKMPVTGLCQEDITGKCTIKIAIKHAHTYTKIKMKWKIDAAKLQLR